MTWKFASRIATAVLVALFVIALIIGINVLSEVWLLGAIALEPFVGTAFAGIAMALPVTAIVYVLMYGLNRG